MDGCVGLVSDIPEGQARSMDPNAEIAERAIHITLQDVFECSLSARTQYGREHSCAIHGHVIMRKDVAL